MEKLEKLVKEWIKKTKQEMKEEEREKELVYIFKEEFFEIVPKVRFCKDETLMGEIVVEKELLEKILKKLGEAGLILGRKIKRIRYQVWEKPWCCSVSEFYKNWQHEKTVCDAGLAHIWERERKGPSGMIYHVRVEIAVED
jgi:hypothetical protein